MSSLIHRVFTLLRRPPVAATLALLIAFFTWRASRPERVLAKNQAAFWAAIIDHDSEAALPLISLNYSDQWRFDRESLRLALRDIASQHVVISIRPKEPETWSIAEDEATCRSRPLFDGRGIGPAAGTIQSEFNALKEPFTFTWQKESWWPWSWRLVRIENPSFPPLPASYRPGMLSDGSLLR